MKKVNIWVLCGTGVLALLNAWQGYVTDPQALSVIGLLASGLHFVLDPTK